MILHRALGTDIFERKLKLKSLIKSGTVVLAGNMKLKIYGTLSCSSGKKMKLENRTFFNSENEAIANGFRPCGHCMIQEYKLWKENKNVTWD
jgi:methylphosphotriester-DNA--protein-cysteine methyltransferase